MVTKLDLSSVATARVWFDEAPIREMKGEDLVWRGPLRPRVRQRCSRAIELFVPVGGRFKYVLIGAEFTPDEPESSIVRVRREPPDEPWNQSVSSLADPRIGLSADYAPTVLDLVKPIALDLGSGTLSVRHFCESAVGTSEDVISRAVRCLRHLFATDEEEADLCTQLALRVFAP